MFEIISYIMAVVAVGLIAEPLLLKKSGTSQQGKQQSDKLDDLLNQRTLIEDTKADLDFDFQTGKLDKEDYKELVKEQDESLKALDNKIQAQSGISTEKLAEQLESEILCARKKVEPELKTKCAKCRTEFKPGAKFCSNCGAKL